MPKKQTKRDRIVALELEVEALERRVTELEREATRLASQFVVVPFRAHPDFMQPRPHPDFVGAVPNPDVTGPTKFYRYATC